MAVNVSAVQFREKNFSGRAAQIIRRSGINPACIEFEVTESAVMNDVEDAARMLDRLKHDGVSIALDDFGHFISKPVRPDKLVDWYYQAQYKHLFA